MLMGRSRVLVGLASMMAMHGAAGAVSLSSVQGSVMVNPGTGYYLTISPVELKPGDLVMVNPGSSAQLSFPDGCNSPLVPGSVVAVGSVSPCATNGGQSERAGQVEQTHGQLPEGQAPGQVPEGQAAGEPPVGPEAAGQAVATAGGYGTGTLILGGAVVAGGVGLAVAMGGKGGSSSKPASP
jgi:hypothetical protein